MENVQRYRGERQLAIQLDAGRTDSVCRIDVLDVKIEAYGSTYERSVLINNYCLILKLTMHCSLSEL